MNGTEDFPALTPSQRVVLVRLARGPLAVGGADHAIANDLTRLGLARLERGLNSIGRYGITPAGRHLIARTRKTLGKPAHPGPSSREPTPPPALTVGDHRESVVTIADMQSAGWMVQTRCMACGIMAAISVDLLAWRFGAKTVLWGRRDRCSANACEGQMRYFARPRGGAFEPLEG